jgi:hypothetical protein
MRLADFSDHSTERNLTQWQAFAATWLPTSARMKALELRDHAEEILNASVIDLRAAQPPDEQAAKSKGLADVLGRRDGRSCR